MFIEAMDHSHGAYLKTFMLAFDTIKNLVAKYLSVRRCQAAWVHKETANLSTSGKNQCDPHIRLQKWVSSFTFSHYSFASS